MLEARLRARRIEDRPTPETWRQALLPLASGQLSPTQPLSPLTPRLIIQNASPLATPIILAIDETQHFVDLSQTVFRLRATLKRTSEGNFFLEIHNGVILRAKSSQTQGWQSYKEMSHIPVVDGLIVFDQGATCPAEFKEE